MLPLVIFFILPAPLNSMHRFKLEIFEEKISAICSKVAAILSLAPIFKNTTAYKFILQAQIL